MRSLWRALLILGVVVATGDLIMAQTDGAETRNKAIIKAAFDAWASGSGSPYDLLADDASWTIVGNSAVSKTYPSREAFMSSVIRPFNADPAK